MFAIAIDGPSSSGKSSIARLVAEKLNILHLNTGALYRAIGLYAYEKGLAGVLDNDGKPILSKQEIKKLIENTDVNVSFIDGKQHTFINGDDVTDRLNTPIVSDYSSRVSAIPKIREHILDVQRNVAKNNNVVMEGRDIASHVLPNAKYKFYITATPEIRALRRQKEMQGKGIECSYEDVLEDIKQRDYRDMTRTVCPLIKVDDAIELDSSNNTLQQMVDKLLTFVKE